MSCCELCGREDNLLSALVEGIKLKVCSACAKFGKVVEDTSFKKTENKTVKREEFIDDVVDGCGELLKQAREARGLSQHDVAVKLNERESLIAKIEQGNFKPNVDLARKLEKFFSLNLIVREKLLEAPTKNLNSPGFTIGDFMNKSP